jgi:prepilin-type processing-associated H-X9-DG protein
MLLVCIPAFLGIIIAEFLLPKDFFVHESVRRTACFSHLKVIGLAMHNYHYKYGCFPPAYVADRNGRPMHSWRVLLLPYLEREDLYKKIRLDEPWNSPHNRQIFQTEDVRLFHCPYAPDAKDDTSYMMIVGPNTISDGPHSVRLEDISRKDGTWTTIMIAEVEDSGTHWAEPRDLDFKDMSFRINDPNGRGIGSYHPGIANVVFADGSVRSIKDDIDPKLLKSLITINGKEDVSEFFRNP